MFDLLGASVNIYLFKRIHESNLQYKVASLPNKNKTTIHRNSPIFIFIFVVISLCFSIGIVITINSSLCKFLCIVRLKSLLIRTKIEKNKRVTLISLKLENHGLWLGFAIIHDYLNENREMILKDKLRLYD